jgi:hypothetical protein
LNLNLGYNQIEDEGAINLGKSISQLINLTNFNINLGDNQIKTVGIISLCQSLKSLRNIVILVLDLGVIESANTCEKALKKWITEKMKRKLQLFVINEELSSFLITDIYYLNVDQIFY